MLASNSRNSTLATSISPLPCTPAPSAAVPPLLLLSLGPSTMLLPLCRCRIGWLVVGYSLSEQSEGDKSETPHYLSRTMNRASATHHRVPSDVATEAWSVRVEEHRPRHPVGAVGLPPVVSPRGRGGTPARRGRGRGRRRRRGGGRSVGRPMTKLESKLSKLDDLGVAGAAQGVPAQM
jgi:hypothetical protein